MRKIVTYAICLVTGALLSGCIKDATQSPAPCPGDKLTLLLPSQGQVALTRSETQAERRIDHMFVAVYRGGVLVHKEVFTASDLTDNGTAQPSVTLTYNMKAGDRLHLVANSPAEVRTAVSSLATGGPVGDLTALLVHANPFKQVKSAPAGGQPMYGQTVWTNDSNTCEMVRSLAKVSVETEDAGLFGAKTVAYTVIGAPENTSMEVRHDAIAGAYVIPDAVTLGGAWDTGVYSADVSGLSAVHYCAPYPISTAAGNATLDKNAFDRRRTSLLLYVTSPDGSVEHYRLDFSHQLEATAPTADASNEYLDLRPNTHYLFSIRSIRSAGYPTVEEARNNPGSNIEYTVTVSGNEWGSSTSNGQYLVKSDLDSVLVLPGVDAARRLVKFACQMPDAGQRPGDDLPGSIITRTVTLVGGDKKSPIPTTAMQMCTSDGTPVADNTFDFSAENIPAGGYQLNYTSTAQLSAINEEIYAKVSYGNIEHLVPVLPVTFRVSVPTTTFTYKGLASTPLRVESYYSHGTKRVPCEWSAEFSTDGGSSWSTTTPPMLTAFPAQAPGSVPSNTSAFPSDFTFGVAPQTSIVSNAHNDALKLVSSINTTTGRNPYNLSNATGDTEVENTANCYVINAPGNYSLPLVYGNSVKNGQKNSSAYTSTASGANILKTFYNHLDGPISDPYIYDNPWCAASDAIIVWQDAPGLVANVGLDGDGKNLTFTVPSSNIKQGNAVVAVRDGLKRIMWSWHIWVTDYVLDSNIKLVTNYQGVQYRFMPVNIGWCDAETMTYNPRTMQVRLTQTRTELTHAVTLNQEFHTDMNTGNQPYFQFGRKDPMLPGIRNTTGPIYDKSCYSDSGHAFDMSGQGKVSIGTTIRNPHVFYNHGAPTDIFDWCTTSYYNIWSANNTVTTNNDNKVVKTVYDPSPVGYCMPPSNAFTGFTYNGSSVVGSYYGSLYNSPYLSDAEFTSNFGWEFYCNKMYGAGSYNTSGGTVFYPASGYRDYPSGTVYNVGNSGYCWSAIPYSMSFGRGLYYYSAEVNPRYNYYRSYGFAVHPVKE